MCFHNGFSAAASKGFPFSFPVFLRTSWEGRGFIMFLMLQSLPLMFFSLDCKESKPVHPKGNQPWIFTGKTDAEAPIFGPPDAKSQLIGKDPNALKDWRQEKGTTEDEMVGWHHWLNGHEFEQAPGDGEGQGNLACCSSRGHKESDMTEWLNHTNIIHPGFLALRKTWLPVSSQLLKCSVTQDKLLRLSVKGRRFPSCLPDTLFGDSVNIVVVPVATCPYAFVCRERHVATREKMNSLL